MPLTHLGEDVMFSAYLQSAMTVTKSVPTQCVGIAGIGLRA